MHELSIARALMGLADRYVPPGRKVRSLQVRVGHLQAIEEGAMRWAWVAATADTTYAGSALELEYLAPRRRCRECGAESAGEPFEPCPRCHAASTLPVGGDELLLVSLEVEEPAAGCDAGEARLESLETSGARRRPAAARPIFEMKET